MVSLSLLHSNYSMIRRDILRFLVVFHLLYHVRSDFVKDWVLWSFYDFAKRRVYLILYSHSISRKWPRLSKLYLIRLNLVVALATHCCSRENVVLDELRLRKRGIVLWRRTDLYLSIVIILLSVSSALRLLHDPLNDLAALLFFMVFNWAFTIVNDWEVVPLFLTLD